MSNNNVGSFGFIRAVFTSSLLFCTSSVALADIEKYVYAYDKLGHLLSPKNSASGCPDPASDAISNVCQGVVVNADGQFNLKLPESAIADQDDIILLSNTYNVNQRGNERVYVRMDSKRRADKISKEQANQGCDINKASESVVAAMAARLTVDTTDLRLESEKLATALATIDIEAVNNALGNGHDDNHDKTSASQTVTDRQALLKEKTDSATLLALATLAVQHTESKPILDQIRSGLLQLYPSPAFADEIRQRVFSHVMGMETMDTGHSMVFLEADKYVVDTAQTIALNTDKSTHPTKFFAYHWDGVESILSQANFSRAEPGNFLVCVTGEADSVEDSSSDCVRLVVKNRVEAIARASHRRVGTGNQMTVSASLSIGANSFAWSGSGSFADANAEQTYWTAPATPGVYQLALGINNGEATDSIEVQVFGVEPVAIAEARPAIVYLQESSVTVALASGSISTDGSDVDSLLWEVVAAPAGNNPLIQNSTAKLATLVAASVGEYSIQLTASKNDLNAVTELRVQVRQVGAPVANAGPDVISFRNRPVILDGTKSYTGPNGSLSYRWQAATGSVTNDTLSQARFSAATLGDYPVILQVTDSIGSASDSATVSVINQLPVASDDVVANLLNEILYGSVVAFDGDRDVLEYELMTQPVNGGVTMDAATGDYVYLPGGVKGCHYQPTAKPAPNDHGGNDVPVIKLCADKYTAAVGETISLTTSNSINASKFSGFKWDTGIQPDASDIRLATYLAVEPGFKKLCIVGNVGQSKNTSTACVDVLIAGNPGERLDDDLKTGYIETFTYQVRDADGHSNPGKVVITMGWKNAIPQAQDQTLTVAEDSAVSGGLHATDADGHAITFRVTGSASLGSFSLTDPTRGLFSYIPNANVFGTDTLHFVANDGLEDSAEATLTIAISNNNDVPLAYFTGVLGLDEDTSVSGQLGGQDADADVLEYRLASIPNHGTVTQLNAATGSFNYTPDPDKNGEDRFFFVVHDGQAESNWAEVLIRVAPINDTPVAVGQGPLWVDAEATLSGKLSATDVDRDVLVYRKALAPSHGSLEINAITGEFVYTPNSNALGSDSFSFTVEDGLASSAAAVVSIAIVNNQRPVALEQTISVFEAVTYGGLLAGTDTENAVLSYRVEQQGMLGVVEADSTSGAYRYRPDPGATGEDFFSFTVFDGVKRSLPGKVVVNLVPTHVACRGPDATPQDGDGDGFSDYVELALGSHSNDATDIPRSSMLSAGISFGADHDGDQFSDISEMWLASGLANNVGVAYLEAAQVPTLSTLRGLPDCLTPLYDNIAPVLQAFRIEGPLVNNLPSLDISNGNGNGQLAADFTMAVMDNASGVASIQFELHSPLGAIVKARLNPEGHPVVVNQGMSSDHFSPYAQAGIWLVDNLQVTDARKNSASYRTADLQQLGYPVQLNVMNSNEDIAPPSLEGLLVLSNPLDLTAGPASAQFKVGASDNRSGIQRIDMSLQSPTAGKQFRTVQASVTGAPLNLLDYVVNSEVFQTFDEKGVWTVTELSMTDLAGNIGRYNSQQLSLLNFAADFTVTCACATLAAQAPTLVDIQLLTPDVDVQMGDEARLVISASSLVGIKRVEFSLKDQAGRKKTINFSPLDTPKTLSHELNSGRFATDTLDGYCVYDSLRITDIAGNVSTWDATQLTAAVTPVQFYCHNPVPPPCMLAIAPVEKSFSIDEDNALTGTLWYDRARSTCGDSELSYQIETPPQFGSVKLDVTNGAYTYTPKANYFGPDKFSFSVSHGIVKSALGTLKISVSALDDVPSASDLAFSLVQDQDFSAALKGSDPDGLPLSYAVVDQPSHGSVNLINATSGVFTYTPDAGYVGSDRFTYHMGDANSTSPLATVNLTIYRDMELIDFNVRTKVVSGLNLYVPVTVDFTLTKDIAQIENVRLSLFGPSGQEISLAVLSHGGAYPVVIDNLVNTTADPMEAGAWKFANLRVQKKGATSYTLVAGDLGAITVNNKTSDDRMSVLANNFCVAGNNLSFTAFLGTAHNGTLLASDAQNDPLRFAAMTPPSLGVLTLEAGTGQFQYVGHTAGQDSFSFVCNDGYGDSTVATVQLTVILPTAPLVAIAARYTTYKNQPIVDGPLAVSPKGAQLTYSVVTPPAQGKLVLLADSGKFTYWPNGDYTGSDFFEFKVSNGSVDSQPARVDLTILAEAPPVALNAAATVAKNIRYSGQLKAHDPDGDKLTYSVIRLPREGILVVNNATGSFTYQPQLDKVGQDDFQFVANDGKSDSNVASVTLNLRAITCTPSGGLDQDGDGYIDYVELRLGTDPADRNRWPSDLSPVDFTMLATADQDVDSYADYLELWLGSNPEDLASNPDFVSDTCFNPLSDGIKPSLVGLAIQDPELDLDLGDTAMTVVLGMLDNASGIRRIRVGLRSPSGTYLTASHSFANAPLLATTTVVFDQFSAFSEAGEWRLSGVTLYDYAGNRLDLVEADLARLNPNITLNVSNSNSDAVPPTLVEFNFTETEFYPGTTTGRLSLDLRASDTGAGLRSVRVDFISPSGVMLTASQTLAQPAADALLHLQTPLMNQHAEDGYWLVFGVLLVDSAGNSVQLAPELANMGYPDRVKVTNPLSDTTSPSLDNLVVLTPQVVAVDGNASMVFNLAVADDLAGVARIELVVEGPSAQVLSVYGEFSADKPLSANAQLQSAPLNPLTEHGTWQVISVRIFDAAGNNSQFDADELHNRMYVTGVRVD